jgi:RNA 2',3'-cyclic 3'-phosphodiesterase
VSPPGATMRLFVALVPPADALAELAAAVDALRSTPGLRWTRPEQWHVTLAFLAEVDDRTRAALVPRLERAAHRHAPLTLALAGGGRFDQVLWTRVDGDRVALRRLAESVRAAARRCGLPIDARRYRPHLTLARMGRPAPDLVPITTALDGFAGRPWTASDLHLVRSVLGAGPGGTAHHEPLASWPLSSRS